MTLGLIISKLKCYEMMSFLNRGWTSWSSTSGPVTVAFGQTKGVHDGSKSDLHLTDSVSKCSSIQKDYPKIIWTQCSPKSLLDCKSLRVGICEVVLQAEKCQGEDHQTSKPSHLPLLMPRGHSEGTENQAPEEQSEEQEDRISHLDVALLSKADHSVPLRPESRDVSP